MLRMSKITAETFFSHLPDGGGYYTDLLTEIHRAFRPRNYFEIGVNTGTTLKLSSCDTIGIDPKFRVKEDVIGNKPTCLLYQTTSDEFFEKYDPSILFSRKIDMAFLDGMHWYEYLLRDFYNTEKYCNKDSVIFLHDCLPPDTFTARREQHDKTLHPLSIFPNDDLWAGDVWKTSAILKKYRPDLKMYTTAVDPTGLVMVTNLDPTSTLLFDEYDRFVQEYKDLEATIDVMSEYMHDMDVISIKELLTALSGCRPFS